MSDTGGALIEPGVPEVYRASGTLVERRTLEGNFTPIGSGNTENIAEYMAHCLDYVAADGRRRATAAAVVEPPRELVVEWENDDYVVISLDGAPIIEVNFEDHGGEGMKAAIVAAMRIAGVFGATVRTVGNPGLEIGT